MRTLVVTDRWPTEARLAAAPCVWRPIEHLRSHGDAVAVIHLRRVLPPLRVMANAWHPARFRAELTAWWPEVRASPLGYADLTTVRYTSAPRTLAEHTWGAAARLLRGEALDALSRELGVEVYRLERWRDRALSGLDAGLKEREGDSVQTQLDAAMRRIGELSMENELLRARIERPGPLGARRSKR